MPQQKNKKIIIYFFLFLIIGSLNNKDISNLKLGKINEINVTGLEKSENLEIVNSLNFLKIYNLFFLDDLKISKILDQNNLIENYSVNKHYPSTLNINIDKTKFLAKLKKDQKIFLLGSNGKLIDIKDQKSNIPFIFGNFKNKNFFDLIEAIEKTNFDYNEIKNLFL